MGNLTTAFLIVLCINVLLWFSQIAITDINPEGTQFFNYDGSMISDFDAGNHTLNDENVGDFLPETSGSISPETGNFWTDPIGSIKEWFMDTTGLTYLKNIVSAPFNFLGSLGLPEQARYGLGVIWYAVTIFLLIAFIFGRDN